jgi:hypothetical protein
VGVLQHGSFHKEEPPISPVNVGEHLRQLRLASGMSVWTLDTKNSFFSQSYFPGGTRPGHAIYWIAGAYHHGARGTQRDISWGA